MRKVIEGEFEIVGFQTGGGKAAKIILEKDGENFYFHLSRIPQKLIIGKTSVNLRIIQLYHGKWSIWWPNNMIWMPGDGYREKRTIEDVFKVSKQMYSKGRHERNTRLVLTSETTGKEYEVFLDNIFPVLDKIYHGHKIKIKEDKTGGSYVWKLCK